MQGADGDRGIIYGGEFGAVVCPFLRLFSAADWRRKVRRTKPTACRDTPRYLSNLNAEKVKCSMGLAVSQETGGRVLEWWFHFYGVTFRGTNLISLAERHSRRCSIDFGGYENKEIQEIVDCCKNWDVCTT